MATYGGQNIGAKRLERLGEGMKAEPEELIRRLCVLLDGSVSAALKRSRKEKI